jgi:enoyl-[acyl-carrier protein] reductase I
LGSRAAKAIGFIEKMIDYSYVNAPLQKELSAGKTCPSFSLDSDLFSPIFVFQKKNEMERDNFSENAITYLTDEVGNTATFLVSPLASAITGSTIYVDNGLNTMGLALDSPTLST